MPTSALPGTYQSFQATIETNDSLYVREDQTLYWAQGREQETDVLIPVSPAVFLAQIAGFISRWHLSAREPLIAEVQWSEVKENGGGNLFASRHLILIRRHNSGETLQRLRKNAGLSQARLAARVGLDPKSISRIERGETRSLRPDTAVALAKALNVGIADLGLPIRGKGEQG